jgi:hypothetical protein
MLVQGQDNGPRAKSWMAETLMKDDQKRRLWRLRDDLADLADADFRPFGFGIVRASPAVRIPMPNGWNFLTFWLEGLLDSNEIIRPRPHPWFDPFPNGSACVRWWGDAKGITAFQKWAERASNLLRKDPDWPPSVEIEPGYHGMIAAFVTFAKQDSELSPFVESRKLVDLNSLPRGEKTLISKTLLHRDPLPTFSVEEVKDWATRFSANLLRKLLGAPIREPRLSVDVRKSTVTLDGKTYGVDLVYVLIVHELLKANGTPITRTHMKQNQPDLALDTHLERRINDLRKPRMKSRKVLPFQLPILTAEPRTKGYYLPSDYLA